MANSHRYIAPGDTIDFLNDTGSALTSGESLETQGGLVGVVVRDTATSAYGVLQVPAGPIYEGPLDTGAAVNYAVGEIVYMNTTTGYIVKTDPTSNGFKLGVAVPGARGAIGGIDSTSGAAAANSAAVRYKLMP